MSALISVDEAIAQLIAARPQRTVESVTLDLAHGMVLAEPVIAQVSRPPAAVSAMDGYAVRLDDVRTAGARLNVIGEAPAGKPFDQRVNTGEAVRIFTGGEMPTGTDHIVIQEDTSRDGSLVICAESYDAPQSVRAAGIDFKKGDALIAAGSRIGSAEIAVASAANHAQIPVFRRLKVAILANGDELRPPGSTLKRGEIISSNPAGLSALIRDWGGEPTDLGIAGDSVASIREHIDRASKADVIVPVGGASVGDHDHMRAAFAEAGFEPVFSKIAVKPGKPTWFSQRGQQRVLGLPGNPASAFVCAHLFLKPLLYAASGLETGRASLSAPISANGPRESFLRGIAEPDEQGVRKVRAVPDQDSSLISPFLSANALIHRRANAPASETGELVDIVTL